MRGAAGDRDGDAGDAGPSQMDGAGVGSSAARLADLIRDPVFLGRFGEQADQAGVGDCPAVGDVDRGPSPGLVL